MLRSVPFGDMLFRIWFIVPQFLQLLRAGNLPCHCAGGSHGGAGQIDFAGHMAHAAHKVAVGGGDAALSLRQYAHIATQAGAAGGSADNGSGLNKCFQKSLFHGLHIDGLGSGYHDTAHPLLYMTALKHLRRRPQIRKAPIGTGTDYHLVNSDILPDLVDGVGILRQMRKRNGGPQGA